MIPSSMTSFFTKSNRARAASAASISFVRSSHTRSSCQPMQSIISLDSLPSSSTSTLTSSTIGPFPLTVSTPPSVSVQVIPSPPVPVAITSDCAAKAIGITAIIMSTAQNSANHFCICFIQLPFLSHIKQSVCRENHAESMPLFLLYP